MEDNNFWVDLINGVNANLSGFVSNQQAQQQQERAEEFAKNQSMTAITAQMASNNTAYQRNSIKNMMQQALSAGIDPLSVLNRAGSATGISGSTASPSYAPPLPTPFESVMSNRSMLQQERQNDIQLLLGLRNAKNLDERLKHDVENALRDYVENVRHNKSDENIRFADLEIKQQQFQSSVDQFRQSLNFQYEQLKQNKSLENSKLAYQFKALEQQAAQFLTNLEQQASQFAISEENKNRAQAKEHQFLKDKQNLDYAFQELMKHGDQQFQKEMANLQSQLRIVENTYRETLRQQSLKFTDDSFGNDTQVRKSTKKVPYSPLVQNAPRTAGRLLLR